MVIPTIGNLLAKRFAMTTDIRSLRDYFAVTFILGLSATPFRADRVKLCFDTVLKDAGIPEGVVMELVGPDSKSMSAHYTHVGVEALEKAVAALPEI